MVIKRRFRQEWAALMKPIVRTVCAFTLCVFACGIAYAQNYQTEKVSGSVFIVSNPEVGESQVVVQSDKGLVVFDTFWSEITARQFKQEIAKALNRDDFAYTLNMIDRLDVIGGNAAYNETGIIGHDSFLEKFKGKNKEVETEVQSLIDMWRYKENEMRERLKEPEKDSETAINEQKWMNTCKRRADELEQGFT